MRPRPSAFESPVFPFTVFTDRRGEVVTLFVGELHRPQAELILSRGAEPQPGSHPAGRRPATPSSRAWASSRLQIRDSLLPATFAAEACHFTSFSGYYRGPLQRDGAGLAAQMARILLLNGPNLNLLGQPRAGNLWLATRCRHRDQAGESRARAAAMIWWPCKAMPNTN